MIVRACDIRLLSSIHNEVLNFLKSLILSEFNLMFYEFCSALSRNGILKHVSLDKQPTPFVKGKFGTGKLER